MLSFQVKTAILSKAREKRRECNRCEVIDYCKYHKASNVKMVTSSRFYIMFAQDSPPEEIQKPLKSTNLVERLAIDSTDAIAFDRCGVSEWDNEYVNIEQEVGTHSL